MGLVTLLALGVVLGLALADMRLIRDNVVVLSESVLILSESVLSNVTVLPVLFTRVTVQEICYWSCRVQLDVKHKEIYYTYQLTG